MPHVILELR